MVALISSQADKQAIYVRRVIQKFWDLVCDLHNTIPNKLNILDRFLPW